ncbi:MAG: hypothetical protein HY553_18890 [Elusimicrobia bacterium]|nr:hypothetical protein [Elusimicrobiota bacterium]
MLRTAFLWVALELAAATALAAGAERFPPPLAADPSGLADRLRLNVTPLRWRELIAPQARVVYVGDTPMRREGKYYLAAVVADLAAAGITHVAVELPTAYQADLDRYCGGRDQGRVREALWETQGLQVGEGTLGLLRASCSVGLRLLALDADAKAKDSGGLEEREEAMAERLARLLDQDPGARVLAVLRRHHVAQRAQPAALKRRGFESRSYAFLTNGLETADEDRRYYLALDAAGLRSAALLLPCPSQIGAQGCLAVPSVLDERP